jgi:prepilin-type N-terminal cleavage/methylation domain-containing protein
LQRGFTLIELLTVVAILAVLGALAVVAYQKYTERARGVDIVEKYDALRTNAHAKLAQGQNDDCAKLAESLGTANLADQYATLSYGFEAVQGGYRPVLNVCAQVGNQGVQGVKAARGAYETLTKNGVVEQNPVLTDSVVSFALRLTDGDAALCKTAPAQTATTCGQTQPVAATAAQSVATTSAQPAAATATAAITCPTGQELVGGNCVAKCATGQVRDASGTCALPACPTGQERVSGNCVAKCATGQVRDASGTCALPACPTGEIRNSSGTCVSPAALLPPVPQPRANQPAPQPVAAAANCPAGQEKVLITSGAQAQSACAPRCQSGERRNTAGLCIKDQPPPPPAWAVSAANPGTPPPSAPPGQLPTCATGTKLVTTFVQGVLTSTCVADACPAGQKPDASGQCVSRCSAPLIWDLLMNTCIDKTSPPACPGGLGRSGDGQCTCASGVLPAADGSCSVVCRDDYGSTCHADFGQAMCTDPFVSDMCMQFCGLCQVGSGGSSALPKRGSGGAPVMPAIAPWMPGILPRNAGETVVLDDQQLAKLFGVVSPDGSPVSITNMEVAETQPGTAEAYDVRRREDGRWQVTATSAAHTTRFASDGRRTYQAVDLGFFLRVTFTNGVGSTQSGNAATTAHN